jgi:SAM-dependent methyltransferase
MTLRIGCLLSTRESSAHRIGIVLLLAFQTLCPAIGHAASPSGPAFSEEASKQDAIYRTRGENVPSGYVVDRSLLAYAAFLSSGFDRSLADLGPKDRWLDIGAGRGFATLDYYTDRYDAMHAEGRERRGKKAQAVAISIEDRRTARWEETAARLEAGQIRYLSGRRLREYSLEELGRFQLITDFTGGFSYASQLSVFMEKVLALLDLNGVFYTMLLDVRPENHTKGSLPPDTQLLTEIENAEGSEIGVCSWLKSIGCVQVTCEADARTSRPVELYRIRKVCDNVAVPSLEVRQFHAGTPPQRRFVAKKAGGVQTTKASRRGE